MKNAIFFVPALLILLAGCGSSSRNDSVDSAYDANRSQDSLQYYSGDMDSILPDKDFMVKAYNGGMTEVVLGNIAIQNAQDKRVKDFGRMMVTDHTKADSELVVMAALKNITLPARPGDDKQDMISKFQGLKGEDFDKKYIDEMIDDHKKDIEEFEKAARTAQDAGVRNFTVKAIPVLQKHLDSAAMISKILER